MKYIIRTLFIVEIIIHMLLWVEGWEFKLLFEA